MFGELEILSNLCNCRGFSSSKLLSFFLTLKTSSLCSSDSLGRICKLLEITNTTHSIGPMLHRSFIALNR